jgi:hydrogenase expression/formation protein HypE
VGLKRKVSELIGLDTGAGCAATRRFIEHEILPRFSNPELAELEDSSVIPESNDDLVITSDSYVVDPPFFPGGNIGLLAVAGTVNDLLASGARPLCMTLNLVIAEGFPMADIRRILDAAATTARSAGLKVVAGDTKVVEAPSRLAICIGATGVGKSINPQRRFPLADAQTGDLIVITGAVGDHAMAVISEREGLGFDRRIKSDCAPLDQLLLPLLTVNGIRAMRDPTRGGVSAVLHELSAATGRQVRVNMQELPVRTEVRFCAEMLGLEPIELENEGKMVMIVEPGCVESILTGLRGHPLGADATVIGRVGEASRQPIVISTDITGRERVLRCPEGASLPRLC